MMSMWDNVNRAISLKLWAAAVLLGLGGMPAAAANKAEVELVPSVSAVAPGESFDVGLHFEIEGDWHIYWKNPGESGMRPKVSWKLPDGFSVGELRFPVPKRHIDRASTVTNILEDEPILLATVTAPEDVGAAREVEIAADLVWLVCERRCLREKRSVSVTLPVVRDASEVKPVNEKLFERARRRMPVAGPEGKLVALKPYLGRGRLSPGSMFEIHLDVRIRRGFHIQSNKPRFSGLYPTDVFMAPTDNVWFEMPKFPKAEMLEIPGIGKTGQFEHEITIRIPIEADEELPGDSRKFEGVFAYQGCKDGTGSCLPPEGVEWSLTVPIGMAAATPEGQERPALADTGGAGEGVERGGDDLSAGEAGADLAGNAARAVEPEGQSHGDTAGTDAGGVKAGPVVGDEEQTLGQRFEAFLKGLGLPGLLLGCFIYGLALNATPCVLPLLSIKVMGFVHQAHESRRRAFALALAFGIGVVLFFIPLGLLAAQGKNVLQYPVAVIALATVVFALALSMLGVYTLQVPTAATKLDATMQKEGLVTSFGKGALAPVLGFACTGPLLAGFFGLATRQAGPVAIASFMMIGLGMASPYILLGANPNWLRFLPKPGNWMITFERVMGFLLMAMVVWLLNPLATQLGATGILWTMAFLVAVGLACWILGRINYSMETAVRMGYRVGAGVLVLFAAVLIYGWAFPLDEAMEQRQRMLAETRSPASESADEIEWRTWSPESVAKAVSAGKTVFVDFTAAWCTVCKANKKLAIETPEVRRKIDELGVIAFRGDFSFGDERISAMLKKHDRPGVPLNLVYPPNRLDDPIVLRPNLTKEYLVSKLEQAGHSLNLASLRSSPADVR
jgi:thiol:disulfide interchange protein DsbD